MTDKPARRLIEEICTGNWARLIAALSTAYTDTGITIWLTSPNRNLNHVTPIAALGAGVWDEVFEEISRFSEDYAYEARAWRNRMEDPAPERPSEPAAESEADKPWKVSLSCCGRDTGFIRCATWEEADAAREAFTSSEGVDPFGYSGHAAYGGHQRAGIISGPADQPTAARCESRHSLDGSQCVKRAGHEGLHADLMRQNWTDQPQPTAAPDDRTVDEKLRDIRRAQTQAMTANYAVGGGVPRDDSELMSILGQHLPWLTSDQITGAIQNLREYGDGFEAGRAKGHAEAREALLDAVIETIENWQPDPAPKDGE